MFMTCSEDLPSTMVYSPGGVVIRLCDTCWGKTMAWPQKAEVAPCLMSAMVGRMSDENGGMVEFLAAVKWSALCLFHGMVDGGGGGGGGGGIRGTVVVEKVGAGMVGFGKMRRFLGGW